MSTTRNVVLRFLTSGDKQVSTAMARIQSQRDKLTSTDVNLTIKADDKDALSKLDETLRKAQETGARKVNIKIGADAKDADATLAAVRAKADELGLKKVNIKVSTDGTGKTTIALAAIATEVAGLNEEGSKSPGMFANFARSAENAATSLDKIIPGLGALVPSGGVGGLFALPVIAVGIGAVTTELTGLAAGVAAAGAGAGAFGLLALPAFKDISTAYQQITTDQKTYDRALTTTAKNGALKHLREDYAKLDPAEAGAVRGINGLKSTYDKMAKAFEPDVFKVFNAGLGVVNSLLPTITPFAKTFADTVTPLLDRLQTFTGSKGFSDWLDKFHSLEGPAITAIGNGIGKVAIAFGKLLVSMPSADIVNAINIGFGILATTIQVITKVVGFSLVAFESYKRSIVDLWHIGYNTFQALSGAWFNTWHYMDNVFHQVMTNVHNWWFDSWHAMYNIFTEVTTNMHNWWFNTWHAIYNLFVQITTNMHNWWFNIWHAMHDTFVAVTNTIKLAFLIFVRDGVLTPLGWIVDGAARAFSWVPGLGGKLKTAAQQFNQFRDNVNAAIGGLSNKTINVSVDLKSAGIGGIPSGVRAPGFAWGGAVRGPGGPKADRIPAMLSDGEYVHQASAVSRYGVPAMHAVNQGKAIIHYASGGPVGFQGFAGGGGVSVHASTPSSASINSLTLGALQNLANSFAKSFVSSLSSFTSTPGSFAGGGAGQWIGLVLQALAMEGLPSSLLGRVLIQINSESGGNPNAINLTDSNAAMGDPSRGLLQTIGSTFAAYHWPGTSNNIYDPLANIAAAINYARHVYGPTLMSGGMGIGSGHGYAGGTNSAARGWAMVGEHGPEAVNFRGGERVIPNHQIGGNTYYITVEVPPTAHPADTGREVVKVIKAYEKRSGSGWRN